MNKMIKGALALQFAIAGVALAQTNTNADRPAKQDDGVLGFGSSTIKAPAGTVRASKLIGTEVYNHQDKHLGEVNDIVLDQNNKKIGYVVLSYGGILGMGDKLFALPVDMLKHAQGQDRAHVELDEQVLRNAPGFDRNNWPSAANADYYKQLDRYYDQHDQRRVRQTQQQVDVQAEQAKKDIDASAEQASNRLENKAQTAGEKLEDKAEHAGHELREGAEQAGAKMERAADKAEHNLQDNDNQVARPAAGEMGRFDGEVKWDRRVSKLIGTNVENSNGDNLGEIHDLVLDWDKGEVRYAVLSYGGFLGIGDKLFAVPMDVFKTNADDQLVLDVPQDQLKNAPGFDRNQWPNMADPQWSSSVDEHYRAYRSERTVTSPTAPPQQPGMQGQPQHRPQNQQPGQTAPRAD